MTTNTNSTKFYPSLEFTIPAATSIVVGGITYNPFRPYMDAMNVIDSKIARLEPWTGYNNVAHFKYYRFLDQDVNEDAVQAFERLKGDLNKIVEKSGLSINENWLYGVFSLAGSYYIAAQKGQCNEWGTTCGGSIAVEELASLGTGLVLLSVPVAPLIGTVVMYNAATYAAGEFDPFGYNKAIEATKFYLLGSDYVLATQTTSLGNVKGIIDSREEFTTLFLPVVYFSSSLEPQLFVKNMIGWLGSDAISRAKDTLNTGKSIIAGAFKVGSNNLALEWPDSILCDGKLYSSFNLPSVSTLAKGAFMLGGGTMGAISKGQCEKWDLSCGVSIAVESTFLYLINQAPTIVVKILPIISANNIYGAMGAAAVTYTVTSLIVGNPDIFKIEEKLLGPSKSGILNLIDYGKSAILNFLDPAANIVDNGGFDVAEMGGVTSTPTVGEL